MPSARITSAVWSPVGATAMNGASSGSLAALPANIGQPFGVHFQADLSTTFVSTPAARLMLSFSGSACTVANAETALVNGDVFGIDLPLSAVATWLLVDGNNNALVAGINDYLRIGAGIDPLAADSYGTLQGYMLPTAGGQPITNAYVQWQRVSPIVEISSTTYMGSSGLDPIAPDPNTGLWTVNLGADTGGTAYNITVLGNNDAFGPKAVTVTKGQTVTF